MEKVKNVPVPSPRSPSSSPGPVRRAVIDVGTNRLTTAEEVRRIFHDPADALRQLEAKGSLLVGDVQPEDVKEKAGAYTPVPGGVGPLTIAMLMANTLASAYLAAGLKRPSF